MRWCPTAGCEKYIVGELGSKKVTCDCGTEICFMCNNIHHGKLSCEASLDSAYKLAMKKYTFKIIKVTSYIHVQNVKAPSKKMMAVIIWLVLNVNMSFVCCASKNINPTITAKVIIYLVAQVTN